MLNYLRRIIFLFDSAKDIRIMLLLFVLNSIFDFISVGIVGPIIAIQTVQLNTDSSFILREISYWLTYWPKSFYFSLLVLFIIKYSFSVIILDFVYKKALDNRVRLQKNLLDYYLTMSYEKFAQRNTSDFIYFIQNVIPDYTNTLVNLLKLISDLFLVFFIVLLLGLTDIWFLILIASSFGFTLIVYDRLMKKKLKDYNIINIDSGSNVIKLTNEILNGKREINVYGVNNYFLSVFKDESIKNSFVARKILMVGLLPRYLFEFLFVVLVVLFLGAIYLMDKDPMDSINVIGTFAFAAIRLLPSLNSIFNSLSQLRYFQNSVDRLHDQIVDICPSRQSDSNSSQSVNFRSISLSKVSFKYSGQNSYILNNIDFKIDKGDRVCILGESGTGKSTLINIITSFLEPLDGKVLYNDNSVKGFEEIKGKMAYIPQNIILLDDSILNNIVFGSNPEFVDHDRVNAALSKAKLKEFVDSRTLGVNEMIGDNGLRVSGGQRQRIALARAFYFNREIIILDEATSALDDNTEREILDVLFEDQSDETTFIIVSHSTYVQKYCNKICTLNNGNLKVQNR